jgi:hypothetical protein
MKDIYKKSPLEGMLSIALKPPKILLYVFISLIIGSLIFHFDFVYWWVKACNFLYVDKVVKFIATVLNNVIPK